jgi:mRNA interferase RelE/StbE
MASYEIEITRTAEKRLKQLPSGDQERVVRAIVGLASEPRPRGSRRLYGYEDVYRVRVGRYRVIYSVSGTKLIIIILKIGHRRDICR